MGTHVLVVDAGGTDDLGEALCQARPSCRVVRVENRARIEHALACGLPFDLVVVRMRGLDDGFRMPTVPFYTPVVYLVGSRQQCLAAYAAGADSCLAEPHRPDERDGFIEDIATYWLDLNVTCWTPLRAGH